MKRRIEVCLRSRIFELTDCGGGTGDLIGIWSLTEIVSTKEHTKLVLEVYEIRLKHTRVKTNQT